jgi:DsbC/DsbD-like thiol-disulfide interchange protein
MIKHLASALALCLATALPGLAQTGIGTPVTAEILPGWVKADGTRVAAIRFKLAPGWKTYWRAPGDAGIPPQFDWSQSDNLRGVGITWPAPKVFHEGGVRTIGYKDELVLPITLAPRNAGKPMRLTATLDFGVCSDICVPQQLEVSAMLDGTDSRPTPAIAAALAARAYSGSEAGVSSATCSLRPTANGLEIETRLDMPRAGKSELVVIEPGQPGLWAGEMDSTRSGGTLTARGALSAISGGAVAIDRSAITITVLGDNQAIEIRGCTPG